MHVSPILATFRPRLQHRSLRVSFLSLLTNLGVGFSVNNFDTGAFVVTNAKSKKRQKNRVNRGKNGKIIILRRTANLSACCFWRLQRLPGRLRSLKRGYRKRITDSFFGVLLADEWLRSFCVRVSCYYVLFWYSTRKGRLRCDICWRYCSCIIAKKSKQTLIPSLVIQVGG